MVMSWHGNDCHFTGPLWGKKHQLPVNSLQKGPVMWSFVICLDVSLNQLLNKQPSCWRFETQWHSCEITIMNSAYCFSTQELYHHSHACPIQPFHLISFLFYFFKFLVFLWVFMVIIYPFQLWMIWKKNKKMFKYFIPFLDITQEMYIRCGIL